MAEESKVRQILRDAGVAPEMIDVMVSTGLDAETAAQLAPALAMAHPAVATSQYLTAQQTYGFTGAAPTPTSAGFGVAAAFGSTAAPTERGFTTNESGALFFHNGVIADPATGDVFFPPNDPSVPGSYAWLDRVQENWDESKIKEWRERLYDYGYDIPRKGGIDQVFLASLQEFHKSRYLNRGKPIPYSVRSEDETQLFTKPEVRNFWRQVFRQGIGDDPTDRELKLFTKAAFEFGRKFLRKGYSPEAAATAAEEKSIEMFESDPKVKFLQESTEDNTALADSLRATVASIDSVMRSA